MFTPFKLSLVAIFAAATLSTQAQANTVAPISYTFDQPTSCGSYCYNDPNYTKLTDGVLGYVGWAVGGGSQWAGWVDKPVVNIDFTFSGPTLINQVNFGTTQDSLGDVALPSLNVYSSNDNLTWTLAGSLVVPPSSANDVSPYDNSSLAGFLTVSGLNIDAKYVDVQALANGPWTFSDEVTFNGVSAVPLPASLPMFGTAFLGLVGLGIRKSRRTVAA